MVPPLTPELRGQDPSLILVEPYKELPVDRDGFAGEPPQIVSMIPFAPFSFFTDRKLYIHNAGHAVLGYLGYLAGYEYGYQALADDEIDFQARGAMEESALALTRKYHPPSARCSPTSTTCCTASATARWATRSCAWAATRSASWRTPIGGWRRGKRAGAGRDADPPGYRHRGRAPF